MLVERLVVMVWASLLVVCSGEAEVSSAEPYLRLCPPCMYLEQQQCLPMLHGACSTDQPTFCPSGTEYDADSDLCWPVAAVPACDIGATQTVPDYAGWCPGDPIYPDFTPTAEAACDPYSAEKYFAHYPQWAKFEAANVFFKHYIYNLETEVAHGLTSATLPPETEDCFYPLQVTCQSFIPFRGIEEAYDKLGSLQGAYLGFDASTSMVYLSNCWVTIYDRY
jgi:hypothetical protein